ncbi:MAG: hypothetical protein H6709_16545 [Kofleriaceae bacterium]|nr:hypothetical protein [Kofleriaceae bacterium]MCB9573691.1 hypothetical protein [Kofleriaceae bacterium]
MIHRGERLEAVLHGGDDQVYLIDLDGGDRLTFVIEGDAAPGACGNWGWAWHEPGGAWVTGNPLPLEPDDGSTRRTGEIPVAAEVADAGDMAPRGGRWALHVQAAPEDCAQIDYALRVE